MKNIISKIILSGLVVGTVGLASAQKIDAKAKKILDDVTANYNSKKNSYFKFSFGSGINGQISKTEPGIYYVAGDKYKLKIMETEQIFDGNKIYNINTEDMEVTIAKPNGSSAMFSPINYLTTYRKDYNVTYNGKKTVDGVSADFIKLTPVKNNGLEAVYIFVNSAKKQMLKLEQHGNNKDVAIIAIKEYKENQNLDPNMFVFDKNKFKNYIITEL
ncbi:LolA family protein [Chryseobacterium gwangjuense]|uniref:LolA family protein n=1 Tax=Chryseobacterium gwangjuense TaxID=1069980 RepID=UPI001E4C5051|nr:outer membrane lipoprotein carrier protein LolA [Chryseobacterium gwangjuense]MCE3074384.1 outer membrane lipoprotein carrier protein LolA [Chryseobacterium gwangjuense]